VNTIEYVAAIVAIVVLVLAGNGSITAIIKAMRNR
jgi:hypothetical protein